MAVGSAAKAPPGSRAKAAAGAHTLPPQQVQAAPPRTFEQLQQVVEAELAREGEREALLRSVANQGERRRLQHFFELERKDAMRLIEGLRAQLH